MLNSSTWEALAPDLKTVLSQSKNPLQALADMETPAIVLRQAFNPEQCKGLIARFIRMGLMREVESSGGTGSMSGMDRRLRIDIGTSLGNRGSDKEAFLQHAVETHRLFRFLFEDFDNPVSVIYDALGRLAVGKKVMTAREADGQLYGPAIFRVHYEGQYYRPHIDHVAVLAKQDRTDFVVSRFKHQFAGVLCFQNADETGRAAQGILHRCAWSPEVQTHLSDNSYYEYAEEKGIESSVIELEQGDFYLFNSGCIHEVPKIEGDQPRIVLAVFIGYSHDDDEVFVWS
ncbi:MAG: hypothetical protein DF168_00722 [Candidatus Moanabacter tarae]|uniref:Fe2OG dioxygenase domain-containing protein n=1 Tax=Candidatus Moanibacter tarae TaxID=2200854 RepID=A0A2Z4APA9_9BACT|nr:MAG: hypothetical protein DF168_00722 [Candidatus Moanabacter tarae]|tara:strand:- start:1820 stop:2680 length:861 start_codon:yes stop_codon:yes gene_type:complete